MTAYSWKSGIPKPKVDAEIFGAIKDAIEAERGTVTAVDIVEEAMKPDSPLRPLFEWNNQKAADRFRVDQARHYLGALQVVRVKVEAGPIVSSRAMFRVRPDGERPGYVSSDRILGDRQLKRQVIASARRELESFISKYAATLSTAGSFVPRLQAVVDEMLDEVERLEADANARRPTARQGPPPQVVAAAAE